MTEIIALFSTTSKITSEEVKIEVVQKKETLIPHDESQTFLTLILIAKKVFDTNHVNIFLKSIGKMKIAGMF